MKYIPLPKNRSHLSERDRKIIGNLGLVKVVINQLDPKWLSQTFTEFDDLFSEGVIGLTRAVDRFDSNQGYKFSSFAVPYIRGEMLRYFERRWFRGGIKISREQVWSKTFRISVLGLDQPLGDDSDETFLDNEESSLNTSDLVEDALWVEAMLEQLQGYQKAIVEYVCFEELNFIETAKKIGVAPVTVSRNYKRAIEQIEKMVEIF